MDDLLHHLDALQLKEKTLFKALGAVHEERSEVVREWQKRMSNKTCTLSEGRKREKTKIVGSIKDVVVGDVVLYSKVAGKTNVFNAKGIVVKVGRMYVTILPDNEVGEKRL
jgi:hypothetical protein